MKRTISLLLVAVLLVACMTTTAFAAKAGETVNVTIYASGEGFANFSCGLSIPSVIESVNDGFTFSNGSGDFFNNKIAFATGGAILTGDVAVLTISVNIKSDAAPGTYYFNGTNVSAYDNNGEPTTISVYGSIEIICDHVAGTPFEEVHIEGDCVTDRCVDTVTKCSKCGEELSRTHNVTTAPGHKYEVTDHKDANCTEDGYTVYTCACGDTYTETHEATGHDYKVTPTTGADCKTPGKDTYTCSCGDSYTVDNDKYGDHSYKYAYDENEHWMVCEKCGDTTEKHPHKFVPQGNGTDKCECGATRPTPTEDDDDDKDDSIKDDTGDITPYPVFILMAIAAVMGTAYGFKRKFEI